MNTLLAPLAFAWLTVLPLAALGQTCRDCAPPPPRKPAVLPPPVVVLQVLAPCSAPADGDIPFEILVENRGHGAAHFVTVKNTIPANAQFRRGDPAPTVAGNELQWNLGTLAPGEARRLLMVLRATGGGEVENCVRVAYEHGVCTRTKVGPAAPAGPPAVDEERIAPPSQLRPPKLDLASDFPARVASNTAFSGKLNLANVGEGVGRNALLSVKLPAGILYEGSEPAGSYFPEASEIRWQLGNLEPGQRRPIELKLKGKGVGRETLTASLQAEGTPRVERDVTIEFFGGVGLHMEIRDTADPLLVGEETQYDILVRNAGNAPASRIALAAAAPAELQLSRPRGPTDDLNFKPGDPTLTFVPFNLQPGQEVIYRVNAKAVRPGFGKFRVQMNAEQLPSGPVLREESTNVLPDLADAPADRVTQRSKAGSAASPANALQ